MFLTNTFRRLALILVSFFGLLILAGIFVWIDIMNELLNPTEMISAENRYLGAGIFISLYYFAAVIEVLAVAVLTRCRWVPFKRGQVSVWLLSTLGLLQVLFYVWMISETNSGHFLAPILLLPFGWSCFWVRRRTTTQHTSSNKVSHE